MKEELKSFSIDIDDIEPNYEPFEEIRKAIAIMKQEYLIENVEVILNKNLIFVFDKIKNVRAVFGCRVSFNNLEKDISFIVREDTKPSYENLEQQLQSYKDKEDKIKAIAKDCLFPDGSYAEVMDIGNKLLQILNEGE